MIKSDLWVESFQVSELIYYSNEQENVIEGLGQRDPIRGKAFLTKSSSVET